MTLVYLHLPSLHSTRTYTRSCRFCSPPSLNPVWRALLLYHLLSCSGLHAVLRLLFCRLPSVAIRHSLLIFLSFFSPDFLFSSTLFPLTHGSAAPLPDPGSVLCCHCRCWCLRSLSLSCSLSCPNASACIILFALPSTTFVHAMVAVPSHSFQRRSSSVIAATGDMRLWQCCPFFNTHVSLLSF